MCVCEVNYMETRSFKTKTKTWRWILCICYEDLATCWKATKNDKSGWAVCLCFFVSPSVCWMFFWQNHQTVKLPSNKTISNQSFHSSSPKLSSTQWAQHRSHCPLPLAWIPCYSCNHLASRVKPIQQKANGVKNVPACKLKKVQKLKDFVKHQESLTKSKQYRWGKSIFLFYLRHGR